MAGPPGGMSGGVAGAEWLRNVVATIPPEKVPALIGQIFEALQFLGNLRDMSEPERRYAQAMGRAIELGMSIQSGRWTARQDRELADVRRIIIGSTDGDGNPSILMSRLIVATLCADRLVYTAKHADTVDLPQLAEIDTAGRDLEAALAAFECDPGPFPLEPTIGGARTRLGQLRVLRGMAVRSPRRASGPAQPIPPAQPERPDQAGAEGPPSRDDRPAGNSAPPGAPPDYPVPSPSAVSGMRLILNALPEENSYRRNLQLLLAVTDMGTAAMSGQAAEIDRRVAEIDRIAAEVEHLGGDAADADYGALARFALAQARGLRCLAKGQSSRPAGRPDPAELRAAIADIESAALAMPDAPETAASVDGMIAELRARLPATEGTAGASPPSAQHPLTPPPPGERDYAAIADAARRAIQSGNLDDLDSAVGEMSALSRELPAGHPARASVLTLLAGLLHERADRTGSHDDIPAATDTAIAAVRASPPGGLLQPAYLLCQLLGKMTTLGHRVGPFQSAQSALTAALETAPDDQVRMLLHLGIGGAGLGHVIATGDKTSLPAVTEAFAAAESLLGEPQPRVEWFGPELQLLGWILNTVMQGAADPDTVARGERIADRLENLLVRHPEFAGQMTGMLPARPMPFAASGEGPPVLQAIRSLREMLSMFGGDNMFARMLRSNPGAMTTARTAAQQSPFATPEPRETRGLTERGLGIARDALRSDPPDSALLRTACTDLRAALAAGVDDDSLRHEANGILGTCLARLHELGEPDPSFGPPGLTTLLSGAIRHLELALAGSEHSLPTPERAALTDLLARCYRDSALRGERKDGKRQAELTAHAALRELARCVLVAASAADGLRLAAAANDIVARSADWCLADERPAEAVAMAEAGRGLVLASSVLSGRVAEILEGAGEDDAARAWRDGGQPGRLTGLNALWGTPFGGSLLRTPSAAEVTTMLRMATDVDAVVYLVPPAGGPGTVARALICHAGTSGRIDELPLRGLRTGEGTPLAAYLDAFGAALTGPAPTAWDPEAPAPGRAWLGALDDLGAWAHEHVMGPLTERAAGWGTGRTPRLALVPLGELAAIPFAAAWTPETGLPGGRRYSIHDLVLSHAVSGRLLNEIARRPRRPLTDRVVLASTGNFPFARSGMTALARQLYPGAEIYGLRNAPNGPGSTGTLLAALLPGADRSAASLLHLTTHGTSEPVARLRTADGWLELSRLLREAADRRSGAAGGLVITSACLTDSTRGHYDESVTLATALLAAGATGVIGTRWPVHEDVSTMLTYNLHHHLARGHDVAQALRLAQLDLLAADPPRPPGQPRFMADIGYDRRAHPASWAGYVYHGT